MNRILNYFHRHFFMNRPKKDQPIISPDPFLNIAFMAGMYAALSAIENKKNCKYATRRLMTEIMKEEQK